MKQTDGYCLKAPNGDLWWNYYEDTMQEVIASAEKCIGNHDRKTWSQLQGDGYRVVRVIVQEFENET